MGEEGPCRGRLFRLLRLVRETQCELEVVKPVLDELEVLRLCCSFGMMPTVNPMEFDFDVLHASEFDKEFADLLRYELLERTCLDKVRVTALFGKQKDVSAALVDMQALCSNETAAWLSASVEGVYCVKVAADGEKNTEKDDSGADLVLFSWIRDELFKPHMLRDTPAFVLRFLTVLSPEIVCCVSKEDLELLKAAVVESEEQHDDKLSLYSVSFTIEKQEDEHDGTECVSHTSADLDGAMGNCSSARLVKGSYPALILTKTMDCAIRAEPFQQTFQANAKLSFAAWLKAESEVYRIDLSGTIGRSPKLCEIILREFDLWPEEQVSSCRALHEKKQMEERERSLRRLRGDIAEQRTIVDSSRELLLQLCKANSPAALSRNEAAADKYAAFCSWVKANGIWKLDRKSKLALEIPNRLQDIEATLFELHTQNQDADLAKLLSLCATSPKANLLLAIEKQKRSSCSPTSWGASDSHLWMSFLAKTAEVLVELQVKWWTAVENGLEAVQLAGLEALNREQKQSASHFNSSTKEIVRQQFDGLREKLLEKSGLLLKVSAKARKGSILCSGTREIKASATQFHDVIKVQLNRGVVDDCLQTERLGHHVLNAYETHIAMFTIKNRSAIQISTGNGRTYVNLVHFPANADGPSSCASERVISTFGKVPSLCDFNYQSRSMAFLSADSVGIYKFDETFKRMDCVKVVDLGVHSTLTAPFNDMLLLGKTVYVTDSSGSLQGVDFNCDQTSITGAIPSDTDTSRSRLMGFSDDLAIGTVLVTARADGSFEGKLSCVALDAYRQLPVAPLGDTFLTNEVQAECVNGYVFVFDPLARKLHAFSVDVTVRSDSYSMRQFDDDDDTKASGKDASCEKCLRKEHWMYTFYHVFEKFPVIGLLEDGSPPPLSVLVCCQSCDDVNGALEDCHDFLSLLMSDLMAVNKPLRGLDLTRGLGMRSTPLLGLNMSEKSMVAFLQTLVTFLPIQICRAEANALTVLRDGLDPSFDVAEEEQESADIAESTRFGLLSPLLSAWEGRVVVITSMGKQSTGKSYFLNHLTGSSFAIAGNRCTDGAWMTLRIMKDVLLVVLDFEGLGSFERTDQEDVFLAVLNASLSMFTIFRMEMRLDKEIDKLFTKFQKGMDLLKQDKRLFRGIFYMSVKDINPNDGRDVLSEFTGKIRNLLKATSGQNFLTNMYSGKVSINCSPPLGTPGYYESLLHAKKLVKKVITQQGESEHGFRSGRAFHDFIRLVLAKMSILDWTTVEETAQQLQMKELHRNLSGIIRTGILPDSKNERAAGMLSFEDLCHDYPEFAEPWKRLNLQFSLAAIDDENLDFGPSVCAETADTGSIYDAITMLFQHYLELILKGAEEKITTADYTNFDAMLSFSVCRRKSKAVVWVKEFLGPERFADWDNIERARLLPFETRFKRCGHGCAQCQLQCMRPACHSPGEEKHNCGMTHVCRSYCEYCVRSYQHREQVPRCTGKAGHEGKCDCGKGDHTCGFVCSLADASNCEIVCVQMAGHDGNHRCSVKQHICGILCSAPNCEGVCVLNGERLHTVHKCVETQCAYACEMESCEERCDSANHFHGNPGLSATLAQEQGGLLGYYTGSSENARHMCASSHVCSKVCEANGICSKSVRVSTRQFSGSFDNFKYGSKRMVGTRNPCAIVLEPGKTSHGGMHSCAKKLWDGRVAPHGCDARCVACEYYCAKPFGHHGLHSAAHGNMRKMRFVAKQSAISWDSRKYAAGEKGSAEMCSLYCSTAGRGHVHYLKCYQSADACVYSALEDHRRHCETALIPAPDHEVDEVLHAEYWRTIGWEDPCSSPAERALFTKCPYLCNAPDHKGREKEPSGCDLPAWHLPAASVPFLERDGVTYINGHRFTCSHAASAGILHHVFVLGCSGSMNGGPWQALVRGVRDYLRGRMSCGCRQDIVSVITFGDKGTLEYEKVKIEQAATRYVNFRGGGTYYEKGLKQANAVLSRNPMKKYQPVLIFFTDGRPADRKQGLKLATSMRQQYAVSGLRAFVVGYGRVSDLGVADLAEHLGGTVHEAISIDDLGDTFRSISMSLGARAGLISSNFCVK